jgi:tetratricopeptide (TPR) repeat protein
MKSIQSTMLILLVLAATATPASAAAVRWTAKDAAGRDVAIPLADRPAVVIFLRPGQQHSDEALEQLKAVVAKQPAAQVVLVFSGPDNAAAAKKYAAARLIAWPVVLDGDYAISGKHDVHVWPATVVIAAGDGGELARLTGLSSSYAADLHAHLDFASRQIDQAARDKRLSTKQVVAATSQQAATRYVIIARALLERGQVEQALLGVEQGLAREPNDVALRVMQATILLRQKKFDAALAVADQLQGTAPQWQADVIRAEALVALERWPEAKAAAADAVKLNPNPAHAHYLSGLVQAHEQDWRGAAEAFRRAYESAGGAQK